MRSEEGSRRGRQSAPAADEETIHRVIDLAALERQREAETSSGTRGTAERRDAPTWTVDLDPYEREHAAQPPHTPTWRISRGLKVMVTLSIVAVLILTGLTVSSYRRGTTWRDIALEQRARGDVLEARVEAARRAVGASEAAVQRAVEARAVAEAARDAASGQLDTSEGDVVSLEQRIAQLAGEKARLEDELAVAGQTVRADADSAAALRRCVSAISGWLDRAPSDGQVVSWEHWTSQSVEWETGCDVAIDAAGP